MTESAESAARRPETHQAAVRALVGPLPVASVAPPDAVGRRLVQDVPAAEDSPRFDNSQMDGYALGDMHLVGGNFPVGPTVPAGTDPQDVLFDAVSNPQARVRDAVIPVMTGTRLPVGTTAVVPVEACDPPDFDEAEQRGAVQVPATEPGQFVRRTGSDIRTGSLLLPTGHVVNPRTVGTAAAQGIATLPVSRRARVLICTGGDEIGGAGAAVIRDANGPMLAALCARHGIEVAGTVNTSDNPQAFRASLSDAVAAARPDAVVTSGGISHGRFEVVRQVLEAESAHSAWFGHVAQQPGGPQGLATFEGVPVICLPGNPVSTAVSFRLFVAPVLGVVEDPVVGRVGGTDTAEGLPSKERFLRGHTFVEDGELRAVAVGGPGSHLLAQSVEADCLLRVPAGISLVPGDEVQIIPL